MEQTPFRRPDTPSLSRHQNSRMKSLSPCAPTDVSGRNYENPKVGLAHPVRTYLDPCLPVLLAESQPRISFKLYDGFGIVIRSSIANEADLNLMVDTGAVSTAINQRLARKLKMTGSREDVAMVNERISVERVEVRNLRLGSLPDHRRVPAVVVDMSPIEARPSIHLDAIIGLDAIGDQDFAIDYHERRILFGAQTPNKQSVSFVLRHQAGAPYLVVPAEIDSQPVSLPLDTGTG
jgi:hypothetical protein